MLSYSNLVLGEPAISTLDKRTTGKEKDNKKGKGIIIPGMPPKGKRSEGNRR